MLLHRSTSIASACAIQECDNNVIYFHLPNEPFQSRARGLLRDNKTDLSPPSQIGKEKIMFPPKRG